MLKHFHEPASRIGLRVIVDVQPIGCHVSFQRLCPTLSRYSRHVIALQFIIEKYFFPLQPLQNHFLTL
jgi:hypothetical protein